jgi:hypothetical protein
MSDLTFPARFRIVRWRGFTIVGNVTVEVIDDLALADQSHRLHTAIRSEAEEVRPL